MKANTWSLRSIMVTTKNEDFKELSEKGIELMNKMWGKVSKVRRAELQTRVKSYFDSINDKVNSYLLNTRNKETEQMLKFVQKEIDQIPQHNEDVYYVESEKCDIAHFYRQEFTYAAAARRLLV